MDIELAQDAITICFKSHNATQPKGDLDVLFSIEGSLVFPQRILF